MFHLAQVVYPDLAVLDGFEGMEGNGPRLGTPVNSHVAVASTDALAADCVASTIMGFDPEKISSYAAMHEGGLGQGNVDKVQIIGVPLSQCLCSYRPPDNIDEIYKT